MKILSVAIPSYNSQDYMSKAIESVLPGGDDVEIIVVDDGSKDRTREIGEEYAKKYPGIVKVISQENGGHGCAVNTGLENATGVYYKVLDSDDWFDEDSLHQVIEKLKQFIQEGIDLDMFIANYVYERPSTGKQKVIRYRGAMPANQIFSWSDIGHFKISENILMHSVIYRAQMLRDCHLKLPKHTFYVDNIFVYQPLPSVKKMYYMDIDLYRYYIGREGQSVNESIMIRRIDQQIKVTKLMIDSHDLMKIENEKLRKYMIKYLSMMMTVSSSLLIRSNDAENLVKRDELWEYLRKANPELAKKINNTPLGRPMQFKTWLGKKIVVAGYLLSRKIYGFS